MFSEVLFGFMAPSAVIISTPNADYNPLLPGLVGFRHPDHKFEWSRDQFQLWYINNMACEFLCVIFIVFRCILLGCGPDRFPH